MQATAAAREDAIEWTEMTCAVAVNMHAVATFIYY